MTEKKKCNILSNSGNTVGVGAKQTLSYSIELFTLCTTKLLFFTRTC